MPGISQVLSGPDYGRRLLSSVIDERAQSDEHHRPYASTPISSNLSDGFRDITYGVFANAINRCAQWLKEQIGMSSNFETLVYIGPSDLRYQILCMAAVKTGHVMFFVSPRNSVEAFMSLLGESAATKLIAPSGEPPGVAAIMQNRQMQRLIIPELNTMLDETPVEIVPFKKSFEEYRMKPWMLLHTSGSTGLPKVVTIRHGYATTLDAYARFGSEVKQRCGNMRLFNPFPPFHMAGIMWSLPIVIFIDATIVLPPPKPLTADLVNSIHEFGNVEYSSLPPAVVTEVAKNESYLQNLTKLRGLTFAGGPLSKPTGDLVCKYTHLNTSYGSTEMFAPPLLPRRTEQWAYHRFNMEKSGIEFRETDDGLYELVLVRNKRLDLMQAIFVTFPELDEYHSKDLFSKHPTQDGLWFYEGRLDDVIVFSSGEKLNPVSMEGVISSSPEVTGALVVGQGKFQSALIVEAKNPPKSDADVEHLVELVWPYVQKANTTCPSYGRIAKELISFTTAAKPLARAGKGTVQRQRSVALYEEEIEELYRSLDAVEKPVTTRLDLSSAECVKLSLTRYVVDEIGLKGISPEDDFFKNGMDSLQLISLVRAINDSVKNRQIEPRQVYDNPSIEKLATLLYSDIPQLRHGDDDIDTWVDMEMIYKDVTWNLAKQTCPRLTKRNSEKNACDQATDETSQSHFASTSFYRSIDDSESLIQMEKFFNEVAWNLPQQSYSISIGKEFLMSMVPPDGGSTAWLQVLASFLVNVNNWGLVNSFGVFQAFYEKKFLADKSSSSIAWIGTIQAALLLIVGVLSGPLFDKGYFRVFIVGAGLVEVFALMMLSLSTNYYQIMLSQGILIGFCCGLLYIPSVALMPLYFKDRRGLALGLATSGASVGGVIYPPVFRRLLNELGFPWATRIIGFIALATLAIAAAITRPLGQMKKPVRELFELSAIKDVPFFTFMISAFFLFCAFLVPFFFAPTFAATFLGTSENLSFDLLAVINAAQFFGRIIPAFFSDYVGGEIMLFSAEVLGGLLGFCWIAVHNLGGFVAFLIFYGFASGMMATLPAVVLPYVCPSLAVIGTRLGMVYAAAGVGALISAPVATAAAGTSGKFLGAQLWMGFCCLVAASFFIVTGIASWRQRQLIDYDIQARQRPNDFSTFNKDELAPEMEVRSSSSQAPILPRLNLGPSLEA